MQRNSVSGRPTKKMRKTKIPALTRYLEQKSMQKNGLNCKNYREKCILRLKKFINEKLKGCKVGHWPDLRVARYDKYKCAVGAQDSEYSLFLQRRMTPGRASDQANRGFLCNFEGYGVRWCPESSWYKTVCGSNLIQNSDMHSRKLPKSVERPECKSALGRWQRSCGLARDVDLTRDILVNMWVKSPLRYLLPFAVQSCYKKFSFFSDHPVVDEYVWGTIFTVPNCEHRTRARPGVWATFGAGGGYPPPPKNSKTKKDSDKW